MYLKLRQAWILFFLFFGAGVFLRSTEWPDLSGLYMGQEAPVKKADVFMNGIISRLEEPEMCGTFLKGGREFYYNALHKRNWTIFVTRISEDVWTKPIPVSFSAGYTDRDFTISPNGNKILFGSDRSGKGGPLDIYISTRQKDGVWGEPAGVGPPINTSVNENYPCMTGNGNIYYFTRKNDGLGGCDLYISRHLDGRYRQPENLGPAVNSAKHDWDGFVAPDESYIIFSSKDREDTIGGQDLYISFRNQSGRWAKAKNMGPRINSVSGEICPSVSPDGKYFFFTSRRRGKADIFWINASIIEELKPAVYNETGEQQQ